MSHPSRHPHLVRGTSAGALATFSSLCAHVFAGGNMPGAMGVVVPLVLSIMVSVLLSGRKLSHFRLALSVVTSQLLFHTLFVLGAPQHTNAAGAPALGHQHGTAVVFTPMQMPAAYDHTLSLIHGDTLMWLSHGVSALITIAFLARGERALLKLRQLTEWLSAWVSRTLADPPALPPLIAPKLPRTARAQRWSVLTQIAASTIRRRGPPHLLRIAH